MTAREIINEIIPEYSDDLFLTILKDGGTEYDGTTSDIGNIDEDILESKAIKFEILHNNNKVTYLIEIEGEGDNDMKDRAIPNYEEYYKDKVKENEKLKEENERLAQALLILTEIIGDKDKKLKGR